jgi:hypothetical protein
MAITIIQTRRSKEKMNLSPSERLHIVTLLEELDALIDCDDGTCFPWKVCERVEIVKEIMGVTSRTEEED